MVMKKSKHEILYIKLFIIIKFKLLIADLTIQNKITAPIKLFSYVSDMVMILITTNNEFWSLYTIPNRNEHITSFRCPPNKKFKQDSTG
jgi:hypothetical protein